MFIFIFLPDSLGGGASCDSPDILAGKRRCIFILFSQESTADACLACNISWGTQMQLQHERQIQKASSIPHHQYTYADLSGNMVRIIRDSSHNWLAALVSLLGTVALFNPKTSVLIQKRHPYTGNLNSETLGDSKNAFLLWGDV